LTDFREAKPIKHGFDRLTSLDEAHKALLDYCKPVKSISKPIEDAVGFVAAETILATGAMPSEAIALRDGFAVAALETIGASAYAPVFLLSPPQWVACGDALPPSADAVLPSHAVQDSNLPVEILSQAAPGDGVRRQGDDFGLGAEIIAAGEKLNSIHSALLQASGIASVSLRTPRLKILARNDLPQGDLIGPVLRGLARALGVSVEVRAIDMSNVETLSQTFADIDADLLISIGGTGFGDHDHAADALRQSGSLLVHGLALHPGETGGCGLIGKPGSAGSIPVILAPGRFEGALAVWLSLAQPCLRGLMGAVPKRLGERLPLSRKITSNPGIADIVLLRPMTIDAKTLWEPLASGDLPWHALAKAEAWHMIAPDSEGYPAGHLVCAEEIQAT
jgi:molybdopterin biosynthesis enzyme